MLQGHMPVKYKRYIKKGEFEIMAVGQGIYYRPWYIMSADRKGFITQEVRAYDGDVISQFVPHPKSILEVAKDQSILKGDRRYEGYVQLKNVIGNIEKIFAVYDMPINAYISYPNMHETTILVKAAETRSVTFIGSAQPVGKEGPRMVDVEEGQFYEYTIVGRTPAEWRILGPKDRSRARLTPYAQGDLLIGSELPSEVEHLNPSRVGKVEPVEFVDEEMEEEVVFSEGA